MTVNHDITYDLVTTIHIMNTKFLRALVIFMY